MKTFQQFKEDMTSVQDTMKGFANTMMPQMKKFAKSDEVKNMKKAQTGLIKKLNDPGTQQKFDNFSRMLKSLSTEK